MHTVGRPEWRDGSTRRSIRLHELEELDVVVEHLLERGGAVVVKVRRAMVALDGIGRVQTLLNHSSVERNGIVSPDSKWLAYESDNSGRFEIYVRPFPNVDAGQWRISTAGGTRPLWNPNTEELFYAAAALMASRVHPRDGAWSADRPTKVVDGPYATEGVRDRRTYDVSPDGRRFS